MTADRRPVLRAISPEATPEEVAAILAALEACARPRRPIGGDDTLHEWVRMSRLRAHRSGLHRGPWRLSGRLPRRARA